MQTDIIERIEAEYLQLEKSTIRAWAQCATSGEPCSPAYHPHLLGFSSGQRFKPNYHMKAMLEDLRNRCSTTNDVDLVAEENLHVTFLALSPHEYHDEKDLPPEVRSLFSASAAHLPTQKMHISKLRIVPLANALVLAGIPDLATIEAQARFAEALVNSPWEPHIRRRYGHFPIPPLLWHTTLLRKKSQYLSQDLRDFYFLWKDQPLGDLIIDAPILALVTYNWSRTHTFSPQD